MAPTAALLAGSGPWATRTAGTWLRQTMSSAAGTGLLTLGGRYARARAPQAGLRRIWPDGQARHRNLNALLVIDYHATT